MTDTSSLLANTQALSSDCLYNLKPSAVRCRQYRCSVPSSNKAVFTPSDTIIAYIPCRRNCFLDTANSYMRYTVRNNETAANTMQIDNNAASFINRFDVYHGSNLLETIQNYDVLVAYLADFQLNHSQRYGLENSWGTTSTRGASTETTIAGGGAQRTFCMPIFSGTIGVMNDKFLPLSLADDIRIEITLNTNALAAVWPVAQGGTGYSIINFELELSILELSDEGMRMVEAVTPFTEPIYMHGSSYRHYSSSLAAASSGQQSFLVPARFASLKSLACLPRCNTQTAASASTSYSISSRINPNMESYWWRVGSLIVPQKAVTVKNANTTGGYAEAYSEILRSFHSLSNPAATSAISYAYYNVADALDATSGVVAGLTAGNSYKNGFAIAQELESFSNRGDVILSGTNTLNSQVFFEFTNNTAIGAVGYVLDFFANYDHILILDPTGLLSVKF